jgi:hypothetical protein
MLRLIGGTIAGILAWIVAVTALNLVLRQGWPAYAAVERTMAFTLPMLATRLGVSAAGSIIGGYVAAWVGRHRAAGPLSGIVLLLLFLPVHYALWPKFPIWYHLTFMISLPLLGWLGAIFARPAVRRA